jgi:hypothetical protein
MSIDTTGKASYTLNTLQKKEFTSSIMIQDDLIEIYFEFVDPVIPILHKPSFLYQIQQQNPLLLNAMYCIASRWNFTTNEEPRGWNYYQQAIQLLHEHQSVTITTIQALFLLLKYNEHVRRPGFIYRTRFYFQMIIHMCKHLPRDVLQIQKQEESKRTLWAIYSYDMMMRYYCRVFVSITSY